VILLAVFLGLGFFLAAGGAVLARPGVVDRHGVPRVGPVMGAMAAGGAFGAALGFVLPVDPLAAAVGALPAAIFLAMFIVGLPGVIVATLDALHAPTERLMAAGLMVAGALVAAGTLHVHTHNRADTLRELLAQNEITRDIVQADGFWQVVVMPPRDPDVAEGLGDPAGYEVRGGATVRFELHRVDRVRDVLRTTDPVLVAALPPLDGASANVHARRSPNGD
jgi:hypothetical protein